MLDLLAKGTDRGYSMIGVGLSAGLSGSRRARTVQDPLPALDLDWATNRSLPASYGPTPSFSRASTGTYFDGQGILKTAAVNGPRFNHTYNGTSWVSRGLLVEEQRTNSLGYSEDFSNAYWTKQNLTISTNQGTAPDGNTTADLCYPTTSGDYRGFYRYPISFGQTTAAYSIFAKASGKTALGFIGLDGNSVGVSFNLLSGTIAYSAAGLNASIQDVGNGWFRCVVVATYTTNGILQVFVQDTAGSSPAVTTSGSSGVLLWGAVAEVGNFGTSYIPSTGGASTTRSADVCQITGTDFSGFWNGTEGTFAVDFDRLSPLSAGGVVYPRTLWVGDGGTGNFINHYSNHGSPYDEQFTMYSGGALQFVFSGYVNSGTNLQKYALAFKNNDSAVSNNGGAVQTDNTCTVPTVPAQMSIGYLYGSTNYLNGHIARLRYYPTRLTNAKLQELST